MRPQFRRFVGHCFVWIAVIEPETDSNGIPFGCMPQKRYAKAETTPLNRYGGGPFCRLKMKNLPKAPGTYALTVNGDVAYVGIARDLAERWGPRGYGMISPRNCFKRGQSTNCKINNRILCAKLEGDLLELWFFETAEPRPIEANLIRVLSPIWNEQTPDA